MQYSQTYVAVLAAFLAELLPMIGVSLGDEQLTSFVQTLVVIGSGIWVLVRRYQAGGVTPLGTRV